MISQGDEQQKSFGPTRALKYYEAKITQPGTCKDTEHY